MYKWPIMHYNLLLCMAYSKKEMQMQKQAYYADYSVEQITFRV